jgi:hypothetical protein
MSPLLICPTRKSSDLGTQSNASVVFIVRDCIVEYPHILVLGVRPLNDLPVQCSAGVTPE